MAGNGKPEMTMIPAPTSSGVAVIVDELNRRVQFEQGRCMELRVLNQMLQERIKQLETENAELKNPSKKKSRKVKG